MNGRFCKYQNGGMKECKGGVGPSPMYYFCGLGGAKDRFVLKCCYCRELSEEQILEFSQKDITVMLERSEILDDDDDDVKVKACSNVFNKNKKCYSGKTLLPLEYFAYTLDFSPKQYNRCYFCRVFDERKQILGNVRFSVEVVGEMFQERLKKVKENEVLEIRRLSEGYITCTNKSCHHKMSQDKDQFIKVNGWCETCRKTSRDRQNGLKARRRKLNPLLVKSERTKLAKTLKDLPCLHQSHKHFGSIYDKDKVPVENFLPKNRRLDVHSSCIDCRNCLNDNRRRILKDASDKNILICNDCLHHKESINDMGINRDGTISKSCKQCKERDFRWEAFRKENLKKIKFVHIIDNESCCKVCGIVVLMNPEQQIPTYIKTFLEDGIRKLIYEDKIFESKSFIENNKDIVAFNLSEFDHLPEDEQILTGRPYEEKVCAVRYLSTYSSMKIEADKCALICKLCHRLETVRRSGHNTIYMPRRIAAYSLLREVKLKGCQLCKYKNKDCPSYFHFDHIDPTQKNYEISAMIRDNMPIEEIKEELKLVRILCANCHYLRTMEQHRNGDFLHLKLNNRLSLEGSGRNPQDVSVISDNKIIEFNNINKELINKDNSVEYNHLFSVEEQMTPDNSNEDSYSFSDEESVKFFNGEFVEINNENNYDSDEASDSYNRESDSFNTYSDEHYHQTELDTKIGNTSSKSFLMIENYDEKYETYPIIDKKSINIIPVTRSVKQTAAKISSPKVDPATENNIKKLTSSCTKEFATIVYKQTGPKYLSDEISDNSRQVIKQQSLSRLSPVLKAASCKTSPVQRAKDLKILLTNKETKVMSEDYDEKYETYSKTYVKPTTKSFKRTAGKISSPKADPAIESNLKKLSDNSAKGSMSNQTNTKISNNSGQITEQQSSSELSPALKATARKSSPTQRAKQIKLYNSQ